MSYLGAVAVINSRSDGWLVYILKNNQIVESEKVDNVYVNGKLVPRSIGKACKIYNLINIYYRYGDAYIDTEPPVRIEPEDCL